MLGDSVTTDHISPAGAFPEDGPAGKYLVERGVERRDFNSFGSRRGNHEVMMRGTFANVDQEPSCSWNRRGIHHSSSDVGSNYDIRSKQEIYFRGYGSSSSAGSQYGTGSSRDWPLRAHSSWR